MTQVSKLNLFQPRILFLKADSSESDYFGSYSIFMKSAVSERGIVTEAAFILSHTSITLMHGVMNIGKKTRKGKKVKSTVVLCTSR